MQSKIREALKLKYHPVALVWADEKPEEALEFTKGRWGCVMSLFVKAAKGKTAAFSHDNFGCMGGGVGLGLTDTQSTYPGGIECFYRFLSSGNADWETGRQAFETARKSQRSEALDNFLHGERYIKTPELVKKRVEAMPKVSIAQKYVIFKPLDEVNEASEKPKVIIFLANPDQLSALVVLANYGREEGENAIVPFGAGCQTIGILAYKEAKSDRPRAIVGLTDISARLETVDVIGREYMTFAVPFKMFKELEGDVEGSFLQRPTWLELRG